MLVKLDHFPRDQGENKKCLSCHHLVIHVTATSRFFDLEHMSVDFVETDTILELRILARRTAVWRKTLEACRFSAHPLGGFTIVHDSTLLKTNIDPKSDGLENVSPFKHGYFG